MVMSFVFIYFLLAYVGFAYSVNVIYQIRKQIIIISFIKCETIAHMYGANTRERKHTAFLHTDFIFYDVRQM